MDESLWELALCDRDEAIQISERAAARFRKASKSFGSWLFGKSERWARVADLCEAQANTARNGGSGKQWLAYCEKIGAVR